MASLSLPPLSAPTSTRRDWGHTGERGSAFRGVSRGRGSANRGDRGRGGRRGGTSARGSRAHGSPPTATDNTNTPTNTTTASAKPAQPSTMSPTNTSTSTKNPSSSLPRPPPILNLPAKPKASARRASQHAANNLPSLTIEPASPTVNHSGSAPHSASPSSSRPSTRSRRSYNKPPGPTLSSENLTVEALASAVKARKSRTSPSSPHGPPKASASRDAPPHLSAGPTVTTFSTKTNIDSLVEHVRALAMDHHRPSTPGSHIDWADEDDSLPDLDDWGVSPGSGTPANANPGPSEGIEKARLQLMSPILDDSLKQLPQNFDKTSPPSPSVGSGSPSPQIADTAPVNGLEDPHVTVVSDIPSSSIEVDKQDNHAPRSSEFSPIEDSSTSSEQTPTSKGKDTPSHLSSASSGSPAPTSSTTPPNSQPGRGLGDSIHAPPPHSERASSEASPEAHGPESEPDIGKRGLAASIHAPKSSSSSDDQRPAPGPRVPTHGRSRTLGRPPAFAVGAKHGFLSGSSTPATARGDATKGPHHARTQSTPPLAASRQPRATRPVLARDAISRLARTLGTALPTKKEVTDTNLTASSE